MTTQQHAQTTWTAQVKMVCGKIGQFVKAVAQGIRRWWKLGDGYQQKGRGWAVSGFIFSLLNIFLLGFVPPLSYLAVVCCVVALCKHNRALISVLGIVLGIAGIMLSLKLYGIVHLYATDPDTLRAFLESILGSAQETIESQL